MKRYEIIDIKKMIWETIDKLESYGVNCNSFKMPTVKWTGLKNGYGKTVLYTDGSMTIRLSSLLRDVNNKEEKAILYNTVVHELFHVLDRVSNGHNGYWLELANLWNEYNPNCIIQEFGTKEENKVMNKKRLKYTICIDGETFNYATKCSVVKSALANKPLYLDGKEYEYTLYIDGDPVIDHFVQH